MLAVRSWLSDVRQQNVMLAGWLTSAGDRGGEDGGDEEEEGCEHSEQFHSEKGFLE